MELPKDTKYAGIRVRLSEATGEAKLANQYWVFTRSELRHRDLLCFFTLIPSHQ